MGSGEYGAFWGEGGARGARTSSRGLAATLGGSVAFAWARLAAWLRFDGVFSTFSTFPLDTTFTSHSSSVIE